MQANARQLNVRLAAMVKELSAAQSRTDSLQQQLQRTTTQHQAELATKAAKIASLERVCDSRDKRISRLLSTAAVNNTLLSSQQDRILELQTAVNSLQQDRDRVLEVSKLHEEKAGRCDEALISLAACRTELWDLQAKCDSLTHQLEATATQQVRCWVAQCRAGH